MKKDTLKQIVKEVILEMRSATKYGKDLKVGDILSGNGGNKKITRISVENGDTIKVFVDDSDRPLVFNAYKEYGVNRPSLNETQPQRVTPDRETITKPETDTPERKPKRRTLTPPTESPEVRPKAENIDKTINDISKRFTKLRNGKEML